MVAVNLLPHLVTSHSLRYDFPFLPQIQEVGPGSAQKQNIPSAGFCCQNNVKITSKIMPPVTLISKLEMSCAFTETVLEFCRAPDSSQIIFFKVYEQNAKFGFL